MDNDVEYGRPKKKAGNARRHPLHVIFDPFYPLIVVAISISIITWYFDIPLKKFIGLNLGDMLRRWMP